MVDFELGRQFPLILIPFRPFQHLLDVESQLSCLRSVRRHLARGGRLIFDLFHTDARRMHDPAFLRESQVQPEAPLPGGRRLRVGERIVAFHRAEQINEVELNYYLTQADGAVKKISVGFALRYFFRFEVEHLLARTGFCIERVYGDFDGSRLEDHSPEMLFVARAG